MDDQIVENSNFQRDQFQDVSRSLMSMTMIMAKLRVALNRRRLMDRQSKYHTPALW